MTTRTSSARWQGDLKGGNGSLSLGSGAFEGQYNFSSRFESGTGTNPEELLGAAHAACFSMALSAGLGGAGFTPQRVSTTAKVTVEKVGEGFKITKIVLTSEASVPNIDPAKFQEIAKATKTGCPVSQALASVPMELDAKLVG